MTRPVTPVDDLKVGQYVCVVASNEEQPRDWRGPKPTGGFCGQPLRIMKISLPFVAVLLPTGQPTSIDVRAWQLKRVNKRYADFFFASLDKQNKHTEAAAAQENTRPSSGRICFCPQCGDKLIERLEQGVWVKLCRQCGFRPVEARK